jgi:hypothetical protein
MTLRFFDFGGYYKILCILRPKNRNNLTPEKPKHTYFPKYTGNSGSIVDALDSLKYDSSYTYRKKIAKANGITAYTGLPF